MNVSMKINIYEILGILSIKQSDDELRQTHGQLIFVLNSIFLTCKQQIGGHGHKYTKTYLEVNIKPSENNNYYYVQKDVSSLGIGFLFMWKFQVHTNEF